MNGSVLSRHNPLVNLFVAFALLLPVAASPVGAITPTDRNDDPAPQLDQTFGQLPLYFVENRGQTDPRVAYTLLGRGAQVYFGADGVTFALPDQTSTPSGVGAIHESPLQAPPADPAPQRRWAVKLDFVGANPAARIEGEEQQEAIVSYFKGSPDDWQTGLRTYARVVYHDLWPGIDLAYYGNAGRLKYDFVVQPGADPAQIRLRYRGAEGVKLNRAGQMEVSTPLGGFADDAPVAWQEAGGRRASVSAAYTVSGNSFGFDVGAYDRSQPLVIDPVVLLYCGYIGGSDGDHGSGIAVDGAGNAYVMGATNSSETSFPATVGPDPTYNGGYGDVFVAKVSASGAALVYAGYIGGSGGDSGGDIAVDGVGNAYVTGFTGSTEATFPVIGGLDPTYNGGDYDAFVAKVSASGAALAYAGYIGGSGEDYGNGIAVDGAGAAYVTGDTDSTEATFPAAVGPDPTYNGGDYGDAFVAKVSASGAALVYAGYIGGLGNDSGRGIAVDGAGAAYVTGSTSSTEATFPVTGGPDPTHNGNRDAFVAKVSPSGATLVYAGYIGASGGDSGDDIAVDDAGNAYVTGLSWGSGFPVTVGPDLTYNGGPYDAFVAKVNPSGATLAYAGYIGGSGPDYGTGIAVGASGNAYVTGDTGSTEATFPVIGGPDPTYNGGQADAFVAKVSASGAALVYAGYIGGSGHDKGSGIAVDGAGNAYVTGDTGSTEATFPVTGGPDPTYNGGSYDAFVAKISSGEEPPPVRRLYLPLVWRSG